MKVLGYEPEDDSEVKFAGDIRKLLIDGGAVRWSGLDNQRRTEDLLCHRCEIRSTATADFRKVL